MTSILFAITAQILFLIIGKSLSQQDRKRVAELTSQVMNTAKHYASFPPDLEKDHPCHVHLQLDFVSINGILDSQMSYSAILHLHAEWTDDRLVYQAIPGLDQIEVEPSLATKMWMPDVWIRNAVSEKLHDVLFPNYRIIIFPTGKVELGVRVTLSLMSDFYLRNFPFDSQMFKVHIETYTYSARYVYLNWKGRGIVIPEEFDVKQFHYIGVSIAEELFIYPSGNFSVVTAELKLQRSYIYYLVEIYLPSSLIVILSWVSFWLDVEAVPARITLGLLTVLTMTSMSSDISIDLPRLSYIKAIDVWAVTCLLFVCAALMEFAYVNIKVRVDQWFMWINRSQNTKIDNLEGILLIIPGSPSSTPKGQSFKDSIESATAHHEKQSEYYKKDSKEFGVKIDGINPDDEAHFGEVKELDEDRSVLGSQTSEEKQRSPEIFQPTETGNQTEIVEINNHQVPHISSADEFFKRATSNLSNSDDQNENQQPSFAADVAETADTYEITDHERALEKVRHIDRVSRSVFPIAYCLFNFVYWGSLFMSDDQVGEIDEQLQ